DRCPGAPAPSAVGRMARRALRARLLRGECRRHDVSLDQWPGQVDPAPGAAAPRPPPLPSPVLSGTAHRHGNRLPAEVTDGGEPGALSADHLRRVSAVVVRRQLQRVGSGRRALTVEAAVTTTDTR